MPSVMNVTLMVAATAIVLAQKLLPPRPFLDATLALGIVAFDVLGLKISEGL